MVRARGVACYTKAMKREGTTRDISGVAAAAHELKSPLSLMRQLALEIETQSDGDRLQQLARRIRLTSEYSLELASGVALAENLHQLSFDLGPVNAQQLCHDVAYTLQPLFREKGKQLVITDKTRLPLVVANPELLRRVVTQFAVNAMEYADDNSAVLVSSRLRKREHMVRIGVRDFGPHVDASIWHSGRRTVTRRPMSSRLGLTIAEQFAHHMNAAIGIVRHRDGASFYVDVPISRQMSWL